MINERKFELFQKNKTNIKKSVCNCPPDLFKQERDWTCSIACIRSLISGVKSDWKSEDEIIDNYALTPQPYFSRDIKRLNILKDFDVIYGCDQKSITFDIIAQYMENGYYIMLESMINYSHWMVLLGCFVFNGDSDPETDTLVFFDPYYNSLKAMLLDEFINVWEDANSEENKVFKDFIAVK